MSPPLALRALRRADIPACHEAFMACGAADGPMIFQSAEELASAFQYPHFGHDLSWLVEDGGRVAGFLVTMNCRPQADGGAGRAYVRLYVRPECRRRGLGTALWNEALAKTRARGVRRIDTTVYATSEAGQAFARRHGLAQAARYWKMRLDPARHRPGPRTHAASLRTYRQDDTDAALLTSLFNASFARHFGFVPASAPETRALEARPHFDRELTFVAELGGRAVGFVRCEVDTLREGWIEVLGVVPEAQGTGLGRRLLDHGVEAVCARGAQRVVLIVVGDNESALRLYESAGFTVELEYRVHRFEA